MCSNPITKGDITFACTSCNDCITARINGWVARAMAEKATSNHCYVLALTYGSDTQQQKDGAAVFRYKDIKDLMKNIRRQAEYHLKAKQEVKFMVCGELGSMKGRVHWHIVLFTSFDLLTLGDWYSFVSKKPVTEKKDKITTNPNRAKRLTWSMWKMGLLTVQIPDQGGMMYALKYALKDQFSLHKSKGTMRETKGEQYASGYFRMSKKPPLGANYVARLLSRLREKGAVLPALKIKIPDYTGYLFPAGYLLEQVITGFKAINDECLATDGRNVPQWSSLLQSVFEQPKIWERLSYVEEQEQETDDDLQGRLQALARARRAEQWGGDVRQRCGGPLPCGSCLRGFSDDTRVNAVFGWYRAKVQALLGEWRQEWSPRVAGANSETLNWSVGGGESDQRKVNAAFQRARECNPFCQLVGTKSAERAFSILPKGPNT